jgi:hypothetical protein
MNGQIFGWDHWTGTALTLSEEVERAEASNVKGTPRDDEDQLDEPAVVREPERFLAPLSPERRGVRPSDHP